ncbi:hypothetical protein [Clostridium sp.]|uniref:hypothetical protein n=1 Tax=Clostridium sp. TaxID=1506 RepID=UPI00257CB8E6|nr:hypothetical protein [Clostridium sp.]
MFKDETSNDFSISSPNPATAPAPAAKLTNSFPKSFTLSLASSELSSTLLKSLFNCFTSAPSS